MANIETKVMKKGKAKIPSSVADLLNIDTIEELTPDNKIVDNELPINNIKKETTKIPASVANILKIKAAAPLSTTITDMITKGIDEWVKKNVNSLDGWVNRDEELAKLADDMLVFFGDMKNASIDAKKNKKAKKKITKKSKKKK